MTADIGEIECVFALLATRFRDVATHVAKEVRAAAREVLRPAPMVSGFAADLFRTREELLAENAILRQQLLVASRKVSQPKFRPFERGLMVALSSVVKNWQNRTGRVHVVDESSEVDEHDRRSSAVNAVLLVKPDTVLRWHREGFRLLWKRKSRATRQRQPRISTETIDLIRDMAIRNRTWGAERIRGELLKLGTRVAKCTIQRHILAVRPPGDGQRWRTFLRNHVVWACDFMQVYDVWFRPLFAFFIIDVNTKEVVHVGVTREPNAQWTTQQLRQVAPFGEGPKFIIRDRDNKFTAPSALRRFARAVGLRATRPLRGLRALRLGADFDRVAKGAGVRALKTAVRAPLMNSTCERFLGSVRRECLDSGIILSEAHLMVVLTEYVAHFNQGRPHQGIAQRVPVPPTGGESEQRGKVVAIPILGGLHHDYRRAA